MLNVLAYAIDFFTISSYYELKIKEEIFMEKTLVIGCRSTESELFAALKKTNTVYDIVWIEARLHNVKKKLNKALSDLISEATDYNTILFATGFCGNSILGLESQHARLIIPRVDDCASLLIGSAKKKSDFLGSYFLTECWLKSEGNIWDEYKRTVARYGTKRADAIFQTMFAHYKRVTILDTGCYDLVKTRETAAEIAKAFSLELNILPGTLSYLEDLLTGNWDSDRFLIVPPRNKISAEDLIRLS